MHTQSTSRSASLVSNSSSIRRSSESTTSKTGSRKSLSRQTSSASATPERPKLARASSSTASLGDYATLKADSFGGWDTHNYSRKIRVMCQMLTCPQIVEEKHRHAHVDGRSYRLTSTFGLLAVDQEDGSAYELGGLALSGLRHAALDDLRRGVRCIGSVLNMTGGIWEWKDTRTINCIYWRSPQSAEAHPPGISRLFDCPTEPIEAASASVAVAPNTITIRLKMLRGFESDAQIEPLGEYKGKADCFRAQYRMSVTSKTLGDVSVPPQLRQSIFYQALPYCKFKQETREAGALFRGKANITNGVLASVAWQAGTWLPLEKSRSGF